MTLRMIPVILTAVLIAIVNPVAWGAQPNVLFIPIDDLNHWVGHLGRHPQTKTPNIDRLATMGVSFSRAYCAAPACNPSRIALMSGLRPSTTGCYDNSQDWRPYVSEDKLLNTKFLDAGYNTFGREDLSRQLWSRRGLDGVLQQSWWWQPETAPLRPERRRRRHQVRRSPATTKTCPITRPRATVLKF